MTDKAHVQKVYEKLEMVRKATPESITVMLATERGQAPSLVLMIGHVPIAKFLHEPNDLLPDFEMSNVIRELFKAARKVDSRDNFDDASLEVTEVFDAAGLEAN